MPKGHMTGDEIRAAILGQAYVDMLPKHFAGTVTIFDPSGTSNSHPQVGSPAEQFARDQGR
jgi:hypothetical protein